MAIFPTFRSVPIIIIPDIANRDPDFRIILRQKVYGWQKAKENTQYFILT